MWTLLLVFPAATPRLRIAYVTHFVYHGSREETGVARACEMLVRLWRRPTVRVARLEATIHTKKAGLAYAALGRVIPAVIVCPRPVEATVARAVILVVAARR